MMENKSEIFLIDSNSLIVPYRHYYSFDLVENFWDQLNYYINNGSIVILDIIKKELNSSGDGLSKWIDNIDTNIILKCKENPKILCIYGEILDYINESKFYTDVALHGWAKSKTADPWLIATAKINDYTIISFEESNGNLNAIKPSSKVKIPDICKEFEVKYENLFYMIRKLHIKI